MTLLSVLLPAITAPEHILAYAGLVADGSADRLWQGQARPIEPHQAFAYAAGAGLRVPAGLGITLMGLRPPYEAALQASSLAELTGHPVIAGYGPGTAAEQRSLLGEPYRSPLAAARGYLTAMRELLAEAAGPAGTGLRVRLGLGVLRPRMARLAGEVADAAITWMTPPGYLRQVIGPALRAGAGHAGRPLPRLTAIVPMALARPGRPAEELVLAGSGLHLSLPHYRAMLSGPGSAVPADAPLAVAASALISCGGFLTGSPPRIAELMRAYGEAGADEIVINVAGPHARYGHEAAVADLRAILRAAAGRLER
jgi:5,10-methylenetetrahydromethanopterin reductase